MNDYIWDISMKYVVICKNMLLFHMIKDSEDQGKILFIVEDEPSRREIRRKGYEVKLGKFTEEKTYRKLLAPEDRLFIYLEANSRLEDILEAVFKAQKDANALIVTNEDEVDYRNKYPSLGFVSLPEISKKNILWEAEKLFARKRVLEIQSLLQDADKVLILTQDDPDPDAIASGLALRIILGRHRTTSPIGTFGKITRPENLAMVKLLEIEIEQINKETLKDFDRIALVDVQPLYFNNGFPREVDVVIDHHPEEKGFRAHYRDIRPSYGATSTILTEYLRAMDIKITQRLATALLYGIKSDTLSLDREVHQRDVDAFSYLYPMANLNILRRIERPQLPLEVLDSFGDALRNRVIIDKILFTHLGEVHREDVIPFLADFCLQVENVEWSVVSGVLGDQLSISVRNVGYIRSAGDVVKEAFGRLGSAGGHRSMAKALIPINEFGNLSQENIRDKIVDLFKIAIEEKKEEIVEHEAR